MTPLNQSSIESAFKSDESLQKSAKHIAKYITDNVYTISDFVGELGFSLTSKDLLTRINGTKLLTEVLTDLPKDFLNSSQIDFLINFYSDRLKDHHNVVPVIINAMSALIEMQNIPKDSIPILLQSFFLNTTCQSQTRSDRTTLFQICERLIQSFPAVIKGMGTEFLVGLISSIDGERDPRNLNHLFTFMPAFIKEFDLLHLSEEMFEIFACYFPIDFNPSKNDPLAVSRDELATKLTDCLVASESFVPWAVSIALEKLESDLEVAKLDSIELLRRMALRFSPEILSSYFDDIWSALRNEVFPGRGDKAITSASLSLLHVILERASEVPEISHNYQTLVMCVIMPHLSDVNQRLFNPAAAIALICIAGDVNFASEKILQLFLLKLNETGEQFKKEERIKVYGILEQIFQIVCAKKELDRFITVGTIEGIYADLISQMKFENLTSHISEIDLELKRTALNVIFECIPILNEKHRFLLFQIILQLLIHEAVNLKCVQILERLGSHFPNELQCQCIQSCISHFSTYSNFIKRKIYENFLPLVNQALFTKEIVDLILGEIFSETTNDEDRSLAFEILNCLLVQEKQPFIQLLQNHNDLIDKLVKMAQSSTTLKFEMLGQIATSLSLIIRNLSESEQYMISTVYLPKLNLQKATDLFIAKGLLGYLHESISLDNHFEQLLDDLTNLSLHGNNNELRDVAHHLICSLVNKADYNTAQHGIIKNTIHKIKLEIVKENHRAIELLSWIAKGLNVRGCSQVADILEALADLLDHPSFSTFAEAGFEIISVEYPQLHLPVVKYLFRQKFFHMILTKFSKKLENFCEHHLNAFVFVLKATPFMVQKMNIEKIGPILFRCLQTKSINTIIISLKICEKFVVQLDDYFRDHLNSLIPNCLTLSRLLESMDVRITSLNLLFEITKYPTYVLLPFKSDVVLELAAPLDDTKRLVRSSAVRARNAWFTVGGITGDK